VHGLSVALRIVDALDQELASEAGAGGDSLRVVSVGIQVGALTNVVPEALLFAWDLATENTVLAGSNLEIEFVDAKGYCAECRAERALTNLQSMRCPVCRTPIARITGGNELEILTVEVV
jgi:hydrogenase nickel incorporation protein HypA/HybF